MREDDCAAAVNRVSWQYSVLALHVALRAQDFVWVVTEYLGAEQGDATDLHLFALAKECLTSHNFAEARLILQFLGSSSSSGLFSSDALAGLQVRLDELWRKSGGGEAGLTMTGIGEYLASYAARLDAEGVLLARDRLGELLGREYAASLNRRTDCLFKEIALQASGSEAHRQRFQLNLALLWKLDHAAAVQLGGLDITAVPREIFRGGSQVLVRSGGSWQRYEPDKEAQGRIVGFLRGSDSHEAMVLSCQSVKDICDLVGCFGREPQAFGRRLCYILVDFAELADVFTVSDFNELANSAYVFRFIDNRRLEEGFTAALRHHNCQFPRRFLHLGGGDKAALRGRMEKALAALEEDILADMAESAAAVSEYYDDAFLAAFPEKIARRDLRVLLWTSRYTVFAQHAIRDVAEAITAIGSTCSVLKEGEQEGMEIRWDMSLKRILAFKPDLVISMNHNRRTHVHENIPWINWVQDETLDTFGAAGCRRFGKYDFWGYAHPHWREKLLGSGYPDARLFHFPIGTNVSRFRPDTGKKAGEGHGAGISYVANCSSTPQEEFLKIRAATPVEFHPFLEEIFRRVASAFAHDNPLWGGDDYVRLINEIAERHGYVFHDHAGVVRGIAEQFWHLAGARFYRQQPLLWLSEAGYDLALYGHGWEDHPLLARHARGYVAHGEALSKIYRNSAVNLSVHETGNYTARLFDGLASGGFFLFRYHPADLLDGGLKDFLDTDTDVLYFSNRDELLEKVDFYLNNRDERDIFVEPVRRKILDEYDYKIIMNKVLDSLQSRYRGLPE